jgi:tetratricopeptide (TPR) repeat protein
MMRGISARLDETAAHTTARLCEFFPLAVCIAARGLTMDSADTSKFIEEIQALREGADAVEAVHRWALDRINAPLRALWTMMSVFPADFGLRAAAAVGAMALSEIGEALHALLDRGLLTRDQSAPRFRMHDRSRRIARSHVDPALLGVAARRHAEHFWSRLHVMQPGGELEAFCELEEASLDAAQAWAEASMEADEAAAIICYDLPVVASSCWRGLRQRDRGRWLLSGHAAARRLGHDERAYASAVRSVEQHGDVRGAPREFHEQTLASVRKLGNHAVEYAVLGRFAGWCARENDWSRAIELRNEQITVARRLGDREYEARALEQLGAACLQVGEPGRAIESYEECLVTARERGDRDGEFVTLDVYARFYARQQDWRRAIALRMDQLALGRSFADLADGRRWLHTLYQLDALVRLDAGRRGDALEAGERCLPADIHSLGDRAAEAVHLDTIARWCEREGDWCHAIALREALLVIARDKGDREWELELQKQFSRTGERHRSRRGSP